MTMQDNIDIVRRSLGRNMHQTKFQTVTRKIDNQRPVGVPIAVAAHHRERRTDIFQIERDRRFTNITQVPNLARACRHLENCAWQFVVRISNDQNAQLIHFRTADGADNADITSAPRKIIRLNPRNPRLALHHVI